MYGAGRADACYSHRRGDPAMIETLRSARLYFWPIIATNVLAMGRLLGSSDVATLIVFAVALSALASAGFLVNDLSDRAIDRHNAARHFEGASAGALRIGWISAGVLAISAAVMTAIVNQRALALTACVAVIFLIYSPVLRRLSIVANLATAVVATSPLWGPPFVLRIAAAEWMWWLFGSAAAFICAREIVMDVRDQAGDSIGGRRTLPLALGTPRTLAIARAMLVMAFVLLAIGLAAAAPHTNYTRTLLAATIALGSQAAVLMMRLKSPVEPADIQHYVQRSRLAMACLPAALLLLRP